MHHLTHFADWQQWAQYQRPLQRCIQVEMYETSREVGLCVVCSVMCVCVRCVRMCTCACMCVL